MSRIGTLSQNGYGAYELCLPTVYLRIGRLELTNVVNLPAYRED
jgi:hypothetical protein